MIVDRMLEGRNEALNVTVVELSELVWGIRDGRYTLPDWTAPRGWDWERTRTFLEAALTGQTIGAVTVAPDGRIVDGATRLIALVNAVLAAGDRPQVPVWPGLERLAVGSLLDGPALFQPEPDTPIGEVDFPVRVSSATMLYLQWERRLPEHRRAAVADAADAFCRWRSAQAQVPLIYLGRRDDVHTTRARLNGLTP